MSVFSKSSPKPKMSVTRYRMAIHMGICQGPVGRVKRIFIGEKLAWGADPRRASTSSETPISGNTLLVIDKEGLFGGEKKEGGVRGAVSVRFGHGAQTLVATLAGLLGRTPETAPGFRGLLTLFFHIGDGGFIWGWNTPYLKPVWVEPERLPGIDGMDWYPETAAIPRDGPLP